MLKKDYNFKFRCTQCECDMQNRMSPGAILRRVQQISTDHCTDSGLTEEVYAATNTVFLLAKTELTLIKPIAPDMRITVSTEAFAPVRASFLRKVNFTAENGELLAQVQSAWVLVNTVTRRIMRHAPCEISAFFEAFPEQPSAFTIQKAEARATVAKVKALYTMCDINGHINNTVYADIICDYFAAPILQKADITRLVISYHNEVPFGESFTLSQGELRQNAFYLQGEAEGTKYFEANLYF